MNEEMKAEEESIALIEQFLTGTLEEDTARELKHKMHYDVRFAAEVRSMKNVLRVIELAGDPQMKAKLEGTYVPVRKPQGRSKASRKRTMRWFWMIGLAGLLIFTGYVLAMYFQ